MPSSAHQLGNPGSISDVYALVNAIDDVGNDVRQWPRVLSLLVAVLPFDPQLLPHSIPSKVEAERLIQYAREHAWNSNQIELLQFICRKLARAALLHDKIADSQLRSRAATRALNHSMRAIVVVNESARVFTTNLAANEIFAQRDGLSIDDHCLRASTSNSNMELRECIRLASRRTFQWIAKTFPRDKALEPLALVFTPANALMRAEDDRDFVVITITCSDRRVSRDPDVLREMFSLTRSEAKLASYLAAGQTFEQSCQFMQISNNTGRTHLKRIFAKTNTTRQSQLVLLLIQHSDCVWTAPTAELNSLRKPPLSITSERRTTSWQIPMAEATRRVFAQI